MADTDGGLRGLFRSHLPSIHWQTIELGLRAAGVPDSNGCWQGVDFWVEFKATKGWKLVVRTAQVGWILRRTSVGGICYIAARRQVSEGARRMPADDLYIIHGRYAREAKDLPLDELPPAAIYGHFSGGPTRWPWQVIGKMLVRNVNGRR